MQAQANEIIFRSEKEYVLQQSKLQITPTHSKQSNAALSQSKRKLIKQSISERNCCKISVADICTDNNMLESFKAERQEGKFYTFDDEKNLVHTISKNGVGDEEITIYQSYIINNNNIIEITVESCKTYLKDNLVTFNDLIKEYVHYKSNCTPPNKKQNKKSSR